MTDKEISVSYAEDLESTSADLVLKSIKTLEHADVFLSTAFSFCIKSEIHKQLNAPMPQLEVHTDFATETLLVLTPTFTDKAMLVIPNALKTTPKKLAEHIIKKLELQ